VKLFESPWCDHDICQCKKEYKCEIVFVWITDFFDDTMLIRVDSVEKGSWIINIHDNDNRCFFIDR